MRVSGKKSEAEKEALDSLLLISQIKDQPEKELANFSPNLSRKSSASKNNGNSFRLHIKGGHKKSNSMTTPPKQNIRINQMKNSGIFFETEPCSTQSKMRNFYLLQKKNIYEESYSFNLNPEKAKAKKKTERLFEFFNKKVTQVKQKNIPGSEFSKIRQKKSFSRYLKEFSTKKQQKNDSKFDNLLSFHKI